ncbi:hypothetical protein PVAND_007148 [Polypedilum vanderplanki]|uniref:PHD finger protein rhinoceros n=1 Tax=Polypedilum vanderplanki TaxID=319348 RepID=A0A9J6C5I7_POLVA|nr:hypothetical protein PVAND_007148 [Polypedilum vanderplanki]
MSQRGKRPNCNPLDSPSPNKRRKGRPPTILDNEEFTSPSSSNGGGTHQSTTVWQARPHLDLKMSSIYNRSAPEAPAELFRKDLISAMKLPDSEPLSNEEYWVITDQWKQEWERGVQVPVNPDSLPEPSVRLTNENYYKARQDFKLPKNKYIRITKDENFSHDKNYLSNTPAIADSVCSYDLDQLDEAWLKEFNGERSMCGLPPVNEEQFERIIEELETRCHDKIQAIMKSEDGLGIEYDENVICDVCRSPDSEEANEMVFCDNCNICVHQACYGITTIPSGQWLCRTCSMGQKPECVLCPNKGGAMKSTRSGQKWAHVSCALWIPEVSIGSVDRMEPITKISSIPQSRWALVCVLCRERVGACIQCSVKTCKTAYHVTCAFQHGLEMRAIIEDENAEDGVKLRSYCQKHSVKKEPKNSAKSEKSSKAATAAVGGASGSDDEEKTNNNNNNNSSSNNNNKKKLRKEMTSEERNHARLQRLMEIQSEFDKHVSVKDISCHLLDVDQEGINTIYNYWILKRKAGGNEPLLLPKAGDVDVMSQTDQEQADIEKMKMFVHLRQDLERVRNLCYMVSRREKLSRSFFKMREQIFHKQVSILSSHKKTTKLDDDSLKAILEANHGPSIYDVLYSSDNIKDAHRVTRIDEMIDFILGNSSARNKTNKSILEINGNIKGDKMDAITRYSKLFNGSTNTNTNRKYSSFEESLSSESEDTSTHKQLAIIKSRVTSSASASTSETELPPSTSTMINTRKSPNKSKNITSSLSSPTKSPSSVATATQSQPKKKKGRPPGSTKQATAEKRRLLNSINSKDSKSKTLNLESSSEDDDDKCNILPQSRLQSPLSLSARNRLGNDDNHHLTDESDELVPIKNSSGHSIPTQGGTIKRMHSSAIYSDSDSSSTDKDNRTDYTVSDSQQQPFRTKAAMKEFNENEVLPLGKLNKLPDITETKKNAISLSTSTKKPPVQSTNQSKKQDLPPPALIKKEISSINTSAKTSPAKPTKSGKTSTKLQNNLSSESEMEEIKKPILSNNNSNNKDNVKDKDKKVESTPRKDILADFLVVPQREAAKKASENLMKTNSNQMTQSLSTSTSSNGNEKNKRDKLEEMLNTTTSKSLTGDHEKKESKDTKAKLTSKSSSVSKEKAKSDRVSKDEHKKIQQKEIVEKEIKNKEQDKIPVDFPTEFLPYVPQRQAAKKAAEHIKGLGNSSSIQTSTITSTEDKNKTQNATASSVTKKPIDRRKSIAIELSASSSTSSSSSDSSDSDSDSDEPSAQKVTSKVTPKPIPKAQPSRRASNSTNLKQKTKDLPFLDKVAKSSVNDETSSTSSYESDSSSDRPHSSRLSEKGGNKSKRKETDQQTNIKKSAASTSPKKSSSKKDMAAAVEKKLPIRRLSTITKQPSTTQQHQQSSIVPPTNKTSTGSRSTQKSVQEPSKQSAESTITTSRKRSTSNSITSPPKTPSSNKSRAIESSKRDMVKLLDKGKSSDLKKTESTADTDKIVTEIPKRRRSSILLSPPPCTSKSVNLVENSVKDTPTKETEEKSLQEVSEIRDKLTPTVEKEMKNSKDVSKSELLIDKNIKEIEVPLIEQVDKNKKAEINKINEETKTTILNKSVDVDDSEVKMDIDDTLTDRKLSIDNSIPQTQESKLDNITPTSHSMSSSPMISIPTENLNSMQDKKSGSNVFEPAAIGRRENTFNTLFESSKSSEDTERATYSLIEKLRQKNKKSTIPNSTTIIADNNNIVNEKSVEISSKSSCMHQNENTPKHDNFEQVQQQVPLKSTMSSPYSSKKDVEFNELKKSSPWHQQQQLQTQQNHSLPENNSNFQRNILTSSCNKMNAPIEQQVPIPASCMVVEQQQKQLAACQKMGEENAMLGSNHSSMFMTPMLMNETPPTNHMDHVFNIQMQQQKQQQQQWPKDTKSLIQEHERIQSNLINRANSGMENMMNNMNQQNMKNFAPLHKSPLQNDILQPHTGTNQQQQGNFSSYNLTDHSNTQYPGAVSLFPPDLNVQVPFPSPGQAMFPPNFVNTFTPSQQQQHQNNDISMIMQTGATTAHIKVNNNEITGNIHHFNNQNQNICSTSIFNQQQQKPQLPNEINMMSNIQPDCKNSIQSNLDKSQIQTENLKKSPSKSTRSSPRNTTPTHAIHGAKTPQKSPSKSPRQPSTPASVESLSRQNSQKGKSTPTSNDGKQRKSRTNSQASPATTPSDHRTNNKGRARNNNKNTKTRFPQNVMPFTPFSNEMDFISISKKLVGTVYDFSADEEFATNPSVENLRAMRDRRKSIDLYNKMNRDGSSQSPKFSKSSLKQSTPLTHPLALNNHTMPNTVVNENESIPVSTGITSLNLVNMPGPVDMRTYNSFDTNTNDSYNSQLLGAFATNMVDQTLNEIDEEQEKELQIALKASNDKQKTPTNNTSLSSNLETKLSNEISNIVEESVDSEASFAKVSLSDSRNQLKLKIKGPLAQHHHDVQSQSISHTQIAPQATSSGTSSNRRQMRKKELLQQYWNQGMNIDQEPSNIVSNDQHVPTNISSNRVGGIPKAVDSMGLSLLKDEFQDFNYAEYKKRKRFALRGADYSVDMNSSNTDTLNPINEIDPLATDNTPTNNKKRNRRPNRATQQQQNASNIINTSAPPKLKIKIGSDVVETTGSDLPPKKRHISAQPPSYQDLKRESMNFRKQMMEEFSEQKSKELKSEKRERKEKKKKKKDKKRSVEIVTQPQVPDGPVKLILKFGKKPVATLNTSTETVTNTSQQQISLSTNEQIPPPIKLKLSRNSQGNGEYNILTTSKNVSNNSLNLSTNNNNLQPPVIDASDINNITTKKLEVSLERIDDIERAKSEISNNKQSNDNLLKEEIASNNCEVR